jgi:hypothetical protein
MSCVFARRRYARQRVRTGAVQISYPSAPSGIVLLNQNGRRSCGHGASSRDNISTAVEKQKRTTLIRSNEIGCQAIEILPESAIARELHHRRIHIHDSQTSPHRQATETRRNINPAVGKLRSCTDIGRKEWKDLKPG